MTPTHVSGALYYSPLDLNSNNKDKTPEKQLTSSKETMKDLIALKGICK